MKAVQSAKFSKESRTLFLRDAEKTDYDLAIIGGGATGAACARDAALRGLKVVLFEADDFASGTSSGSSKLIHGGIRYLENFEFGLVYEAIQERERLNKLYAPFVRHIDFVFPTYKNKKPSKFLLGLGLTLYDSFSFFKETHQSLNRAKTIKSFPYLRDEELTGSMIYADSFAEDYRLVIELIKSAVRHSAICLSRTKVIQLAEKGTSHELIVEDRLSGKKLSVKAKRILNCSGPFSDQVRQLLKLEPTLHLTQGVHFIVPAAKLPIDKAFVLSDPEKNRILFAIPWNSVTYLGTTDTSVQSVGEARAHKEDLNYVLKIANQHFNQELTPSDVIQSWAAVRPLIEASKDQTNSEISREHQIRENPKGVFHVLGGKLTSHRSMGEEAVDLVSDSLGVKNTSLTAKTPLQEVLFDKAARDHLEAIYGHCAEEVREIGRRRPDLQTPLKKGLPHISAEIKYAIEYEMCLSPLDFLRRRSSLYYESPDPETVQRVSQIFYAETGATEEEKASFESELKRTYEWDQRGYLS